MHGIPDQMSYAAAEMQKKGEGGPEKHDLTDPGRDAVSRHGVGLRSVSGRNEPDDQHDREHAQNHAGARLRIDKTDVSCGR